MAVVVPHVWKIIALFQPVTQFFPLIRSDGHVTGHHINSEMNKYSTSSGPTHERYTTTECMQKYQSNRSYGLNGHSTML